MRAVCTDCVRTSGLLYKWQLFKRKIFVENPAGNTPSGVTGVFLTVVSSKLSPGENYRLYVSVRKNGGKAGNATIDLETNKPPVTGQCSVDPVTGDAMKTQFKIKCQGWSDPDLPLPYKFMYKKDGDVTSISSGPLPSARSVLPVGDPANDNKLYLLVRVTDSLGLSNQITLQTKVDLKH